MSSTRPLRKPSDQSNALRYSISQRAQRTRTLMRRTKNEKKHLDTHRPHSHNQNIFNFLISRQKPSVPSSTYIHTYWRPLLHRQSPLAHLFILSFLRFHVSDILRCERSNGLIDQKQAWAFFFLLLCPAMRETDQGACGRTDP